MEALLTGLASGDETIYGVLLAAVLLFMAAFYLLHRFRTLSFAKHINTGEDSAKIYLKIKNRSGKPMDYIQVIDFVPTTMTLQEEFDTVEPDIENTPNGTRLKWRVESLQPGESRLLGYSVKSDMETDVTVTFPRAELETDKIRVAETSEIRKHLEPREST